MVHQPTRGDVPARLGPGVEQLPDVGPATVDADVYRDPARYEQERTHVLRSAWLVAARSSELPGAGDWVTYEGHGEVLVVSRQSDGTVAAFHDVCQHRGSRLTRGATSGCDRRLTCPWHGWVYDTTGTLVGVPEREDFDPTHLDGLRAPTVATDEWAGWVWVNMGGEDAPRLLDWIGPEIVADLGRFGMEDMVLHEKLVFDLPVNYKAVVDGFNEVYHVTELHHVQPEFTRAARDTSFHLSGPNSMMFVPNPSRLDELATSGDHVRHAICHYVVFPNTVFNNNPDQIQLFQPVPLSVDSTRFICWDLMYGPEGDDDRDHPAYLEAALNHWAMLQRVVGEDLFVFSELAATRDSMGYRRNVFSEREAKLTHYHRVMEHCLAGGEAMDFWDQSA
ncbi:MAG: aromatic ring-hydroxylating dioxygenase subunit alpha [Acidimicrobiia bacterium]|nr:aromatic ring-hydroxylating dioxygenase subunit alpha [Acidimicrobiia bacterium]